MRGHSQTIAPKQLFSVPYMLPFSHPKIKTSWHSLTAAYREKKLYFRFFAPIAEGLEFYRVTCEWDLCKDEPRCKEI